MNTTTNSRTRRTLAAVTVALLGLAACGSDDASTDVTADATAPNAPADGISIADPWSREPADGQTTSAVYGAVTNNTDATVTAVSATTSVTDTVELHEVLMNDEGQMSMQEKDGGFAIAPGETFLFEPGGPHIMLLGIDPATYPDSVDVTLSFDDGSTIDFTAEVRAISDDSTADMGDMDEMDDTGEMDDADHSGDDTEMDEMDEMDEAPTTEG